MLPRRFVLSLLFALAGAGSLGLGCGGSGHSGGGGLNSNTIVMNPLAGSTLPPGTVATVYTQTFVASGAVPPYTFTAVSIPPGLSIVPVNGEAAAITGMPTTPGTTTVTLQVVDSTNATVTDPSYSITIK